MSRLFKVYGLVDENPQIILVYAKSPWDAQDLYAKQHGYSCYRDMAIDGLWGEYGHLHVEEIIELPYNDVV